MLPRPAVLSACILATVAAPLACDVAAVERASTPSIAATLDISAVATITARSCDDPCPRAVKCDLGGEKFCGAFDALVSGLGLPDDSAAALGDACAAEQQHCDLCQHMAVMCAVVGNGADACAAAEAECNCLAEVAGAP